MKPTPTEALILREGSKFLEMVSECLLDEKDSIRKAFETDDDAWLGAIVKCAIHDYAEGLDSAPKAEPDAAHESRLIDRDNAAHINRMNGTYR